MQLRSYLASGNPFLLSPQLRKKTGLSAQSKSRNNQSSKNPSTNSTPQQTDENTALLLSTNSNSNSNNFMSIYSSISQMVIPTTFSEETNTSNRYSSSRRRQSKISYEDIQRNIQELEVTDLAGEFLGSTGKLVYQSALMLLTYVGLLAYTQVFSSSFTSQLWPESPSAVPVIVFAVIVVPLACFDLSEQVTVQIVMSLLRFFSLGVLLFGTLAAIFLNPNPVNLTFQPNLLYPNLPLHTTHPQNNVPLIRWSGFGVMLTTAIFSQLFQHSVPGLIRPLACEHKKAIPRIFQSALATTALIYVSTGIACVIYFGDSLQESVNLNFVGFDWGWKDYTANNAAHNAVGNALRNAVCNALVTGLAMVVVLFPALDTLSVFPLIAITLGNNIQAAFPCIKSAVRAFLFTARKSAIFGHLLPSPEALPPPKHTTSSNSSSTKNNSKKESFQTPTAALTPSNLTPSNLTPAALTLTPRQREQEWVHRGTVTVCRLLASLPPILTAMGLGEGHLSGSLQVRLGRYK